MMLAVDVGDYALAASFFSEDAHLDLRTPIDGQEAIAQWLSERPQELPSRHVLSNIVIKVDDDRRASGASYLTFYRHLGEASLKPQRVARSDAAAVGDYATEFERDGAEWLIKRRSLKMAFRRDDF
jgi:hypothetical protein